MEMFTKEAMIYLMDEMLRQHPDGMVTPEQWLKSFDYKAALRDRLMAMYRILRNEYIQKHEANILDSPKKAYHEGALCRLQVEMGIKPESVFNTIYPDSPDELRLSYMKGFNSHREFGSATVIYPKSITEKHY